MVGIKLVCQPSGNSAVGVSIHYSFSSPPFSVCSPCPQWTQAQNLSGLTFPKNKPQGRSAERTMFQKGSAGLFSRYSCFQPHLQPHVQMHLVPPTPESSWFCGENSLAVPTSTPHPLRGLIPSITQRLPSFQHFVTLVSSPVSFVRIGLCLLGPFIVILVGFHEGAEVVCMSKVQF